MAGINSHGNYITTSERDMAAFDRLPPRLRAALRDARHDWACSVVWTYKLKHGVEKTLAELRRLDEAISTTGQ